MKEYVGMAVNFQKTIKFDETDINTNNVFAELNIIMSDVKYDVTNTGDLSRITTVSEIEIAASAKMIRQMVEQLEDVANKLEELEEREAARDRAMLDSEEE